MLSRNVRKPIILYSGFLMISQWTCKIRCRLLSDSVCRWLNVRKGNSWVIVCIIRLLLSRQSKDWSFHMLIGSWTRKDGGITLTEVIEQWGWRYCSNIYGKFWCKSLNLSFSFFHNTVAVEPSAVKGCTFHKPIDSWTRKDGGVILTEITGQWGWRCCS